MIIKFKTREKSILFGIVSPNLLCKHLGIARTDLSSLLTSSRNYKIWLDAKSQRQIQEPKTQLMRIHRIVSKVLSSIETPDFLHSAKKGVSYITNAAAHPPDQPTVKIDVKKFYVSIKAQAVYHFFKDRMACQGDVAGILTKLLTVNGHLPTGSSASPILSYFAYEDMYHALCELAKSNNCVMTVYIDDIVFSGSGANKYLLNEARKIMSKFNLKAHKLRQFHRNQPKIITGVAMTIDGSKLPNKRQKNIRMQSEILAKAIGDKKTAVAEANRLISLLQEATQIDKQRWQPQLNSAKGQHKKLTCHPP